MRAFILILRLLGYALSLALLAYFVVREFDDRWLTEKVFPAGTTAPVAPTAEVAQANEEAAPEPASGAGEIFFEFDAEKAQASLEEELLRTQSALARALEAKLLRNLDNVRGAYEERGELMTEVRDTVGTLVAEIAREGEETATETASAIEGIERNLQALSASSDELDRSLQQWAEAYHNLTEIEKISSRVLDERNYTFVTYEVGTAESLAQISRKLAAEHGVENADLGTLIPMFNDIEMQTRQFGTRRAPERVVANETLRIPLPKTTGELLDERQMSARLLTQRAIIEGAKRRQEGVQVELGGQVAQLRRTVQRVEGLRELTGLISASLESLDDGDALEMIGDEATPAQRDAWEYFNQAFRQYRLTPDSELRQLAKQDLESATRALLDAYIKEHPATEDVDWIDGARRDTPSDLAWLEAFIERYEPRPEVVRQDP